MFSIHGNTILFKTTDPHNNSATKFYDATQLLQSSETRTARRGRQHLFDQWLTTSFIPSQKRLSPGLKVLNTRLERPRGRQCKAEHISRRLPTSVFSPKFAFFNMARIKSEQIKRVKGIKDAMAAPLSKTPVDTDKKKRRKLKKSLARQLRRQIRDLQQSTKPMISKAPVQRLCREIAQNINEADPARFTQCLQAPRCGRGHLHDLFHDA